MDGDRAKWEGDWGMTYDEGFKREQIPPILEPFKKEIGPRVLDIGSGQHPVSEYLTENCQIVSVDFSGSIPQTSSHLHLKFNIKDTHTRTKALQGARSKAAKFFKLDPRTAPLEQVDTVFVSDILSYVDFRQVLAEAARYLKPGGLLISINRPGRGELARQHANRLKDNFDLYRFLESDGMNFKIERKKPISKKFRSEIYIPEAENDQFIVLVARKLGPAKQVET